MSQSKKIVLFSLKKVYSNGILSKIKSEVGIHFDGNADTPTPGKVERLYFESLSDVCSPVTYEISIDTDMKTECIIS